MLKHKNRLLEAAGSAAAAGAIIVSCVTGASAASPSASRTRAEALQFMIATPEATTATVIAHGAFTASGVGHPVTSTLDKIVFNNGAFKFRHPPQGPTRFSAKTCLGSRNQHGPYKIFGGTG